MLEFTQKMRHGFKVIASGDVLSELFQPMSIDEITFTDVNEEKLDIEDSVDKNLWKDDLPDMSIQSKIVKNLS